MERSIQALIARVWLKIFDWPGLNYAESVIEICNDFYLLISSYKDLFKEEVGCSYCGNIGLLINQNAVPRFIKLIPFALRQVEREFDRLER